MWKSLFGRSKGPQVGGNKELLTISTEVAADAESAFGMFVDNLNTWWPRDLTWSGDDLQEIGIEARIGGQCYEAKKDGTRLVWGSVLALSRPKLLVIAWQIAPDRTAIDNEAIASRVDLRFSDTDDGGSIVLVVHRDFPRHGDGWEKYREDMAGAKGWPLLIERYRAAVSGD